MTVPSQADVDEAMREDLLRLAAGDVGVIGGLMEAREQWQKTSRLDPRSFSLVKIAALVALDSPPASYAWQVTTALESGATPSEILGVLVAVAPQVGGPRVAAAAPEIMMALGLALPEGA